DLKPANVMLGDYGETLVVDWGLARREEPAGDLTRIGRPLALSPVGAATQHGQVIGTPAYLPPEQARGALDEVGPPSDVWALAADVERWLADEPVSAYHDPLTVRALRWARRRRTLVASLLVLLLGSVAGLAAGLAAVGREQARTARALKESEENLHRALKAEA